MRESLTGRLSAKDDARIRDIYAGMTDEQKDCVQAIVADHLQEVVMTLDRFAVQMFKINLDVKIDDSYINERYNK